MNDSVDQTICDLCMSRESKLVFEVRDRHLYTPGVYRLVRCRQCGLIRLDTSGESLPDTHSHETGAYAPHRLEDGPGQPTGWRQQMKEAALAVLRGYPASRAAGLMRIAGAMLAPIMGQRLNHVPRYLPEGRLLDAGSGAGHYANAMANLGWRAVGLEPEIQVCQQASRRGQLALIAGRIERAPFASRAFDVITLWHTLEHTASPRHALKEARRLLHAPAAIPESQVAGAPPAANGVLMLETPNAQSIQARFFGRYWFHLDAPRHRFHFTPATLEAYLHACGFREVRLRHLPSSVGITGSIQALFDQLTKHRGAGLRESRLLQALVWPLAALEALVGRGGCVQVSARATPAVMSDSGDAQPDHAPVALSVVIVTWNCRDQLQRCLESLQLALAGLASEIIVVDNDSHDATAAHVRDKFPETRLLQMEANAGFAVAANRGMQASRGEAIWLLNPDTLSPKGAPRELLDALNQYPRAGAVGPRIVREDGRIDPLSVRRYPTLFSDLLEKCGLPGLAGRITHIDLKTTECPSVPLLSGAGMCLHRHALAEIGWLDESFILYGEDMDLCRRLWAGGWEIRYCGAAHITHAGGGSSRQCPEEAGILAISSMARYLRKHHGPAHAGAYRAAIAILSAFKACLFALAGSLAPSRETRRRFRKKARLHRRLLVAWRWETRL